MSGVKDGLPGKGGSFCSSSQCGHIERIPLFVFLLLTVIGYVFIFVNAWLWRSEGNLGNLHHVRPEDQTVVLGLSGAIAC